MLDAMNKEIKEAIAEGFSPTKASDTTLYPWDTDDEKVMEKALKDYMLNEISDPEKITPTEIFRAAFSHGVSWGHMMGRTIREV